MIEATDELRERLVRAVLRPHPKVELRPGEWVTDVGPVVDELAEVVAAVVAEARTEALNEVAEILSKPGVIWHGDDGVTVRTDPTWREPDVPLVDWIRQRVAAIREGGNQNAEPERHKVCTCWRLNPAGTHQRGCDFFVADQKGTEQ